MSQPIPDTQRPNDADIPPVTTDPDSQPENESSQTEASSASKQKRRRTSPRDHAILESAYLKNSKPDKEERLRLVEKVELGEKEVQIWFQNRRQNDRRKSKPLQPHELIPHFRNGIPLEATTQLPSPQNSQETTKNIESDSTIQPAAPQQQSSPRINDIQALLNVIDSPATSSPTAVVQRTPVATTVLSTPPSSLDSSIHRDITSPNVTQQSDKASVSEPQVAKKRSHEQMVGSEWQALPKEDSPKDAKSLRRTSSFVRLALSADGSAKIRVNDETTPSPPKERPQPPPNMQSRRSSGLTRAQSDVATTFQFRDPAPKGAIGRSRDARTWEFYCDRGSRSSLAARAEEAATGSAVGALGLVRSASQRRIQALSSNPAKQNLRRTSSGYKSKSSLSRAQSSLARLQGSDGSSSQTPAKTKPIHRRQRSGSDSDKENWMPGTRDSVHDFRRTRASGVRETAFDGIHEAASAQHSHPRTRATEDQENRPTVGSGKDNDLDCVQGLLSLSQGAWR